MIRLERCINCKYFDPVSHVMGKCWKGRIGRIPKTITGWREIHRDNRKCKDFELRV